MSSIVHGMSSQGVGLANTALLMAMIKGLMAKGLIGRDVMLWLNNATTLVEEDKTVSQPKTDALAVLSKLLPLTD